MPIPGVTFEWEDQSDIPSLDTLNQDTLDRPIYMFAFTADKGPEEWTHKVFGRRFFDLYGTPSFRNHGQASIQAARVIQEGGYVTAKRVVADDSMLANIVLVADVQKIQEQETDNNGAYLWTYTDPVSNSQVNVTSSTLPVAGVGGIPSGVTISPLMVDATRITYRLQSYAVLGNNLDAFAKAARTDFDNNPVVMGNSGSYPLFILADMGRGVSKKRFRIYQDETVSRPVTYHRYFLEISEDGNVVEVIPFTMNSTVVERDRSMGLAAAVRRVSRQIRAQFFDDIYEKFIENIEYLSGVQDMVFKDALFGYDLYGKAIKHFYTNATPLLDTVFGNPLVGGSYGSFGTRPAQLDRSNGMNIVDIKLKAAFAGNTDDGDDIYDMDNNRIDCIFDCNYHSEVKRAIEQLVNFREDLVYFRDCGTMVKSYYDVVYADSFNDHSRYSATYINFYDTYDPYTRKQVTVTVTYHLAALFVNHFINGRIRPFCGQKYGIVIPSNEIVDGTLNFVPKRTPKEDQRQLFDDMRINYLSYYDGNILTMNSEYTSQTRYTQLSWINNVLGIQEIIKAIRRLVPKIRYSFLDGDDLAQYREDVQTQVIDKFQDRFQSCTIEYASNAIYDSNKLIYAIIRVKFRNFVQTEIFKIIALQS
jgi:hypothetical protein